MVTQELISYIQRQLNAGYDAAAIKNVLMSYGYDSKDIDEAFNQIYKKPKSKQFILFAVAAGIIILAAALFFALKGEKQEKEITEIIAPEQPAPAQEFAKAEIEKEFGLRCPAICDDRDKCTIDYCGAETNYKCVNEPITPCCGNNICEPSEDKNSCPADCKETAAITFLPSEPVLSDVVSEARDIALSSPSQAADYCNKQKEEFKDSCYNAVALAAKQSTYCSHIQSVIKRDVCYKDAALEWNDFSVCDKINDHFLRTGCKNLAEIYG